MITPEAPFKTRTTLPKRFTYPSPGFSHYWNQGVGRKMLQQLKEVPSENDVEQYAQLLLEADTLADTVIKQVYEVLGFQQATKMIDEGLEKGIENIKDAPPCLQQLLKEADTIPNWLNPELLNAGSDFCCRTGSLGLTVLRNYCLMGGYESSAINKPLIYTGALKKGAAKRMAETIEFWVQVTGKGAMQKGAIGHTSAVKLRLMHSYARTAIQKVPGWSNEQWGLPLNHADMIATNLGFSLVFMEGLKRLGFRPTQLEVNGVLHLWKYIGYLIGIPAQHLPDTETEAIEHLYKWTISQPPADEDTRALALALMNEPLTASFPVRLWQKKLLIKLHLGYNYYFLDDRACTTMGLPETSFRHWPALVKFINGFFEAFTLSQRWLYRVSVFRGRKSQEIIKTLFLKSHATG
ncbi:MAG: hypothetical protein JWO06_1263 [Bacteroidota bacterium]|nr:hypothetical protein [Bacteroidota bacterium]